MIQRLFVYGTLGPGRANEHILENIGGTWEKGSVNGHLKAQGWGADMGYPGIVLAENGNVVHGYIFTSDNLIDHWRELDLFEGEEYSRVITTVTASDGAEIETYIYTLAED